MRGGIEAAIPLGEYGNAPSPATIPGTRVLRLPARARAAAAGYAVKLLTPGEGFALKRGAINNNAKEFVKVGRPPVSSPEAVGRLSARREAGGGGGMTARP